MNRAKKFKVHETLERKIAKAIHDQVPVYTQKDERTGVERHMVDFWLLFADKL